MSNPNIEPNLFQDVKRITCPLVIFNLFLDTRYAIPNPSKMGMCIGLGCSTTIPNKGKISQWDYIGVCVPNPWELAMET